MEERNVDTGVNWVGFLRAQAQRAFIWDEPAQYFRVRAVRGETYPTLLQAWDHLGDNSARFPNLAHNLFADQVLYLSDRVRNRINRFFIKQGLTDFEFLDHGGRALAYRARHIPTGQMRIVRMESPHSHRFARPQHAGILQPFASNQDDMMRFGNMKLEVLPEIMPLSKIWRSKCQGDELMQEPFSGVIAGLSRGTNMLYSVSMFDADAEPQNVGLRPDGRIVSLDPEVVTGARAERQHRHFITPFVLRDASLQQLALIYPRI